MKLFLKSVLCLVLVLVCSSPAWSQDQAGSGFLPLQEPSSDSGTRRPPPEAPKAVPRGNGISLIQAQQNGIPTPIAFKPVAGKLVRSRHNRREYQDNGVMNKPTDEKKTYYRNEKILFAHPDGSEYSSEIWLDYPGNPSKSGKRSIYKRKLAQINERLRQRFPVPVLKPGIAWQGVYRGWAKVPVQYRVTAIKTVNGHDCVEVDAKGQVTLEERFLHQYSENFCYDYNYNEFVYYKSHYRLLITNFAEPLAYEKYHESRLESLAYE